MHNDRFILYVRELLEVIECVCVMRIMSLMQRGNSVIIASAKTHIRYSINVIRIVFRIIIHRKLCKIVERYGIVPIFR